MKLWLLLSKSCVLWAAAYRVPVKRLSVLSSRDGREMRRSWTSYSSVWGDSGRPRGSPLHLTSNARWLRRLVVRPIVLEKYWQEHARRRHGWRHDAARKTG